jgi:hypothetical protein
MDSLQVSEGRGDCLPTPGAGCEVSCHNTLTLGVLQLLSSILVEAAFFEVHYSREHPVAYVHLERTAFMLIAC